MTSIKAIYKQYQNRLKKHSKILDKCSYCSGTILSEDDRFPWEGPNGEAPYSNPDLCRACGGMLLPENRRIADCCPCNSGRGVNHGLVPKNTCTCVACDPAQTGSTRYGLQRSKEWWMAKATIEGDSPVCAGADALIPGGDVMGTKNNPGKFDCYENADPDEPMFVLLARDRDAPLLVHLWAQLRQRAGENPSKIAEAIACSDAMVAWRKSSVRK